MKNRLLIGAFIMVFSFLLTGCGKDQIAPRIREFGFWKSTESGSIQLNYKLVLEEPDSESGMDRYEFSIFAKDGNSANMDNSWASPILVSGASGFGYAKYDEYRVDQIDFADFSFPARITTYTMKLEVWDREGNSRVDLREVVL